MDYKIKLQTNNTALEGNNTDLQGILNTINNLPSASQQGVNLDAEITEQESLIDQIQAALEGKAVGGGNNEIELITTTISEEEADGNESLTIPELIGAKYFIIQGNPLSGPKSKQMSMMEDAGTIHSIIYLNGYTIIYFPEFGGTANTVAMACEVGNLISFDETTGTVSTNGYFFYKITTDTTTTGVVYTVYRLG